MFGFQRLDAYRTAITFLSTSSRILQRVPRGHRDLKDQLRRAALSIPLNVAEGSGRVNRDAGQFYSVARGSALECAAILDALEALELLDGSVLHEPRQLLVRVVSMLSGLVRLRSGATRSTTTRTTTTSTTSGGRGAILP
jgi:four helix bundle protein